MVEKEKKILTYIGFAIKAGKVVFGYSACKLSCEKGKSKLLLTAKDVSKKTKENFIEKYKPLFFVDFLNKDSLGKIFHKDEIGFISIENEELAKVIKKEIET